MTTPPARWLDPTAVAGWLKMTGISEADRTLLDQVCAAAQIQVQRARPEMYVITPGDPDLPDSTPTRAYVPDAEVLQAGIMLGAKVFRRRNSPGGLEAMADTISYVARYDPEIDRALRQGSWRRPALG